MKNEWSVLHKWREYQDSSFRSKISSLWWSNLLTLEVFRKTRLSCTGLWRRTIHNRARYATCSRSTLYTADTCLEETKNEAAQRNKWHPHMHNTIPAVSEGNRSRISVAVAVCTSTVLDDVKTVAGASATSTALCRTHTAQNTRFFQQNGHLFCAEEEKKKNETSVKAGLSCPNADVGTCYASDRH